MDKKIAGLLGAVATLGAMNTAQAAPLPSPAPTDVLRANSFADLLEPIANAAAVLQAVDESQTVPLASDNVVPAQFYYHHHHHHHHHHAYRPRIVIVPPYYRRHHHHHHHHHHSFYRRDY